MAGNDFQPFASRIRRTLFKRNGLQRRAPPFRHLVHELTIQTETNTRQEHEFLIVASPVETHSLLDGCPLPVENVSPRNSQEGSDVCKL